MIIVKSASMLFIMGMLYNNNFLNSTSPKTTGLNAAILLAIIGMSSSGVTIELNKYTPNATNVVVKTEIS